MLFRVSKCCAGVGLGIGGHAGRRIWNSGLLLKLRCKHTEFGLESFVFPVERIPAISKALFNARLERGDALHEGRDRALSELGLQLSDHMGMVGNSFVQDRDLALEPFDLVCPFAAHQGTAGLEVAASRAGGSRSAATEAGFHWNGTGSATMVKWSGLGGRVEVGWLAQATT